MHLFQMPCPQQNTKKARNKLTEPNKEYEFMFDNMTWSFSRASSFEQCKYGWKLTYLDKKDGVQNGFSSYGLFHHKMFELFWSGVLDVWDMPDYYKENYAKEVDIPFPAKLEKYNFSERTYKAGLDFWENFDWNLSDWDILGNEYTIEAEYNGIKLTIRPDTLVKNKKTGKIWLIDYKTSTAFDKKTMKPKTKKIDGYKKQLSLYCYFVEREMNIEIEKYVLVFPKYDLDQTMYFDYNKEEGQKTVDWLMGVIEKAKLEVDFKPNVEPFFCENLCSMKLHCQHWQKE